jgi:hypothetical protein
MESRTSRRSSKEDSRKQPLTLESRRQNGKRDDVYADSSSERHYYRRSKSSPGHCRDRHRSSSPSKRSCDNQRVREKESGRHSSRGSSYFSGRSHHNREGKTDNQPMT